MTDLHTPIQYLKGIGPKRAKALEEHGIATVRDLLYYFPFDYIDLSRVEPIGNLRKLVNSGQWVTIIGTVRVFDLVGRPPRQRVVVVLGDETGTVQLVFFQSVQFFKRAFTIGETLAASGKPTQFGGRTQMVHPSIDRLTSEDESEPDAKGFVNTRGLVPKYGSSEELRDVQLHVKGLRRIMKGVVDEFSGVVAESLPSDIKTRLELIDLPIALRSIHFPESRQALDLARRRLKFDELFSLQLALALRRRTAKVEAGIAFNVESKLARHLVDSLPYRLTSAQIRVVKEIAHDMSVPKPMNRLLQGDVGSGKTVVALIAMLIAVDNGYQAVFMAPTEILAEQHYRALSRLLERLPVNIRLLVGGQKSKVREDVLEDIRRGSAQIVVGTHALIQDQVEFTRLGLAVIDEQHRFGVTQRVALRQKGTASHEGAIHPDMLVMTATPIPRTLSLTVYGDLDVSVIDELPADRQAIKTILNVDSKRNSIYRMLRDEISKGRQAYIVYPLIEESEKIDLKSATESFQKLKSEIFPDLKVGLIHGRMISAEKDAIMESFQRHELDILVATTVIEVGIDVANATVMVIEHAERFGLSQLHQLRGRVGRGSERSYCILMAPDWLGKIMKRAATKYVFDSLQPDQRLAERRLGTMIETSDGFKIAEIDLELRGPGDFFGTRQSGLPKFQIANLLTDGEILTIARREAFSVVENDPQLRLAEHQPLRKFFKEHMKEMMSLIEVG